MRPFVEEDFPITAIGNRVYRRIGSSPVCIATTDEMAQEIAKRLNRDNQVYPETYSVMDEQAAGLARQLLARG